MLGSYPWFKLCWNDQRTRPHTLYLGNGNHGNAYSVRLGKIQTRRARGFPGLSGVWSSRFNNSYRSYYIYFLIIRILWTIPLSNFIMVLSNRMNPTISHAHGSCFNWCEGTSKYNQSQAKFVTGPSCVRSIILRTQVSRISKSVMVLEAGSIGCWPRWLTRLVL